MSLCARKVIWFFSFVFHIRTSSLRCMRAYWFQKPCRHILTIILIEAMVRFPIICTLFEQNVCPKFFSSWGFFLIGFTIYFIFQRIKETSVFTSASEQQCERVAISNERWSFCLIYLFIFQISLPEINKKDLKISKLKNG